MLREKFKNEKQNSYKNLGEAIATASSHVKVNCKNVSSQSLKDY